MFTYIRKILNDKDNNAIIKIRIFVTGVYLSNANITRVGAKNESDSCRFERQCGNRY